ncbi:NAD(P)-dependent dehydrogenase (short-subunit alcohol dehydrogenase family) [Streptomyces turgidiscabies]|uniref:NAD(P)-dependent dehydrogenase (Short-subunit alcohol dehydrogenase family) n=1 Tax=Streptomyces turgidiscabies TaxID=85558 RepID=A0ABU0RDN0_9ACTN|nr:NAD(P)-dependent dehydrogenase (short-subunit alcohol dehydrogenase family) [Streptomyces turgidiscabies]
MVRPAGDDPWVSDVVAALGAEVTVLEAGAATAGRLAAEGVGRTAVVWLPPAEEAGVMATLRLVQAAREAGLSAPLWVVTRRAVAARPGDQVDGVWHGGVWGLGRVAALELPGLWGGLVDLPEDVDQSVAARLSGVLSADHGEDQLAIRSSGVLARRLVHAAGRDGEVEPWRTSGTAIVTGGTGGLGGYVARWLVDRGAEHVVLLSRRGADAPGAADLRAGLEAAGARVTVLAGDVADRSVLTEAFAAVQADLPLRTVVHAAGVGNAFTPVEAMTPDQLAGELRVKAEGALLLDELTEGMELDAFVLFSSGAASWGGSGQGGYAAGNACLDSLAEWRRARGRTATSIAWGTWAEAGMAAGDSEGHDYLARLGLSPMAPELAITALQRVVEDDETTVTVSDTDWATFTPAFTLARPSNLFALLPEAAPAPAAAEEEAGDTAFVQRLAALEDEERREQLLALVREHTAAVLGHDSARRRRPRPGVPGRRIRLADRGRAAQPAPEDHRSRASHDARLRLPEPEQARRPPGRGTGRRRGRGGRAARAEGAVAGVRRRPGGPRRAGSDAAAGPLDRRRTGRRAAGRHRRRLRRGTVLHGRPGKQLDVRFFVDCRPRVTTGIRGLSFNGH